MQNKTQGIMEVTQKFADIRMEYWLNDVLFSFNWWLLFVTTVVVSVVWVITIDKKRILSILTYGFLIAITGSFMDILGSTFQLWQYEYTLTPILLPAEIHVIQMPMIFMLIYQRFRSWKGLLIASTVTSFVFSYILEPLLEWLHIYKRIEWELIYSFFIYIAIAVVFKWVINKLKQLDKNH